MKAVEGFPFYIFLMLLTSALFVGIAFQQLRSYQSMRDMYIARDNYLKLVHAIKELQLEANGSLRTLHIEIPAGYTINFSGTKISLVGPISATNDVNVTLYPCGGLTSNFIQQGKYEIIVYKGWYDGKELTICIQ